MEFAVLGWPPDGPALRLDYRAFSYAGKFVVTNTGKAVVRVDDPVGPPADADPLPESVDESAFRDDILAVASFNEDRTESDVLWIRYISVHREYRGGGLGARLAAFVAEKADEREYDRQRIAVNNPFAYRALAKAGFAFTGRETGLAELVLERPGDVDASYPAGLDVFADRDLTADERRFVEREFERGAPEVLDWRDGDKSGGDDADSGS